MVHENKMCFVYIYIYLFIYTMYSSVCMSMYRQKSIQALLQSLLLQNSQ